MTICMSTTHTLIVFVAGGTEQTVQSYERAAPGPARRPEANRDRGAVCICCLFRGVDHIIHMPSQKKRHASTPHIYTHTRVAVQMFNTPVAHLECIYHRHTHTHHACMYTYTYTYTYTHSSVRNKIFIRSNIGDDNTST